MSYLNLPSLDLEDLQKGVISLWFRFSQDSVDKAAEYRSETPHPEAPGILDNTMPLVTFGRKVMAKVYDTKGVTFTLTIPPPGGGTLTQSAIQVEEMDEAPCGPSHIGILMSQGSEEGEPPIPKLVMKFQTETRAQVQGLVTQITDVTWSVPGYTMHRTIDDVSYVRVAEPESFLIVPAFEVNVDQWHHLLVSFDFSTGANVVATEVAADNSDAPQDEEELRTRTIKSFCKVWLAFDDENKSGKDNIGNNTGAGYGQAPTCWVAGDENGIIPQNAEAAVFSYIKVEPLTDGEGKPLDDIRVTSYGEYHWSSSPLVTQNGPMGFPASDNYVETIYHCEMAEFQFFSGVTLDTNDEASRRAFVDEDGKPVPPNKSGEDGFPGSIELLGQRPDVLLRGSGNWKKGHNTGTTGIDDSDPPEDIPSGQFEPTALIATYKPNPSLYGPQ